MIALVPTHYSRAIARIGSALAKYAPSDVTVKRIPPMRKDTRRSVLVPGEAEGDVVVIFANGLRDHQQALAERCIERGQKFAVVQIALRTTRHPHTSQWRDLWSKATVVMSYYPLAEWIKHDGGHEIDFDFYNAPLGVDSTIFFDRKVDRTYVICTSGQRRNQEGVGECDDAAIVTGGSIFQLGPSFSMRSPTTFLTNLSDNALAEMYSRCQFVSGLRRHEGFELPAAEGLLAKARPILYDRPHYRMWYEGLAEFIAEGSPAQVTADLTRLFRSGPCPVTDAERSEGARRFNWESIAKGFWERALA